MQVSIYLDFSVIDKINLQAKKSRLSRSKVIQNILTKNLMDQKQTSVFDEVFGILAPSAAESLLHKIKTSRRNSQRFS